MARTRRVRLMIDFPSKGALQEWAVEAKRLGFLPEDSGIFQADGLDIWGESGVATASSYLVRDPEQRIGVGKRLV